MKKTILTLGMMLLIVSKNYSQWTEKYYVDDFGDKTEESYKQLTAYGTFSNSATQDSKLIGNFILDSEVLVIDVYEYGSSLATDIESTLEDVKIKLPSGDVVTYKNILFSKKGYLVFSKEDYTKIVSDLTPKGSYVMIFNRTGEYSESSYKLKFEIK